MGVKNLPKTVTRQRRDCDLNPGPSAPEFSTLTTRLPSHPTSTLKVSDNDTRHYVDYISSALCMVRTPAHESSQPNERYRHTKRHTSRRAMHCSQATNLT